MSKLSPQDIYDISEFVIHNIETFVEQYMRYGSNLTFPDYVQSRVATQLNLKYNRYDIAEAFENEKLKAIVEFYVFDDEEEQDKIVH